MEISYFENAARARKAYDRLLQPVCRKWELSRNAVDTLLFLLNNPQFSRAADIVSRRGLAKSHVSQAVTELEERGLLRKEADGADRRSTRLLLTPEGTRIGLECRLVQERFFRELLAGIPQEDLELWQRVIGQISSNLRKI